MAVRVFFQTFLENEIVCITIQKVLNFGAGVKDEAIHYFFTIHLKRLGESSN